MGDELKREILHLNNCIYLQQQKLDMAREALEELYKACEPLLRAEDVEKETTRRMAELAALARTGDEGAKRAKAGLRQLQQEPRVFDVGNICRELRGKPMKKALEAINDKKE